MATWKKALICFLVGGGIYFLMEIVFRLILHREQGASFIILIPAGGVTALLCLLDDRGFHAIVSAVAGAMTVSVFEAVIGTTFFHYTGIRLWDYGRWEPLEGFVCLRWLVAWFWLCLAFVWFKRIWEQKQLWKKLKIRKRKD